MLQNGSSEECLLLLAAARNENSAVSVHLKSPGVQRPGI